jgi:uncharacterized damage-inducible protein DinB
MKDKAYLRGLLEYNSWANADLFEKVMALPADEVTKKREASLESINVQLNHMLVIDRIWLGHMEGRDHGYKDRRGEPYGTLEETRAERQATDTRLLAYLDELDPNQLEEMVEYQLIGSSAGSMSRAMCITHLVMHGSYHRGWTTDMFCQAKAQQPIADLPVYERVVREQGLTPLP